MIDINKSYIEIYEDLGKDAKNIDIKSLLKTEKQDFYLLKHCRTEVNTIKPFSQSRTRFEWLPIVDDNVIYTFSEGIITTDKTTKHKKHLVNSEIKYLNFEETFEHVLTNKNNKIYCHIKYKYQNINYELISKCELMNYSTIDNDYKYLQPILGYVLFIDNKEINYGYAVVHDNKEKSGYLEYLLKEKSSIFDTNPLKVFTQTKNNELKLVRLKSQNLPKLLFKNIMNKILFFKKKNDFTKLISIKDYKINYFTYI